MFPAVIFTGRPTIVALSSPVSWIGWNDPSRSRAEISPQYSGTAQSTPSTLRTRFTSMSRIGTTSFTCSTFASQTQMGTLMFRSVEVVHSISPQKTPLCCVISSAQNVSPPRSMTNFATSP